MPVSQKALDTLKLFAQSCGADVLEHEPMCRHTTFKIGGPADLLISPLNADAYAPLLACAASENVPVFILGNGSNLLFSDRGFRGAVIKSCPAGEITAEGTFLRCSSGEKLSDICVFAREKGLAGLEFAYGIPGSVGGAVYMNAGAYGGEMKDVVFATRHLNGGSVGGFAKEQLCFSYRTSAYTGTGLFITDVTFALRAGDKAEIDEKMCDYLARRREKQPLEWPSAGSVFKRPPGHFAGTMIEQCGLKGARVGGAMVSEKHAGFIVNAGGATCADVLGLVAQIKKTVYEETGVSLECEIKVAGE